MNESAFNEEEKQTIKERCAAFIVKLICELQQGVPNLKLLKNLIILSVSVILKPNRLIDNIIHVFESLGWVH